MEATQQEFKKREIAFYGSKGATQFKLGETKDKNPLFLVEAANVIEGQDKAYNWKNDKVTISLSPVDLMTLLNGIRLGFDKTKLVAAGIPENKATFDLFHDPGKGSATEGNVVKSLSINKGQQYGYLLNIGQKVRGTPDKITKVNLALSDANLIGLRIIFEYALLVLTGFKDI